MEVGLLVWLAVRETHNYQNKNKKCLHYSKRRGFVMLDHTRPVCAAGCCSLFYLQQGVDQCVQTQVSIDVPQ